MNLLKPSDHFQIVLGPSPIAVGAPHHGSRPNVDADWGTGPIALALSARMGASCVVVTDMRHTVDVNKDPLSLTKRVRLHALRYQNALFANRPRLLVEIHGHVSGHYDIEVGSGFELDRTIQADIIYLEKLDQLRSRLPAAIENYVGVHPTVGVWPLDRDVEKTATNTFTFQKVRRARRLSGLEWYGLHIELNSALRFGNRSRMGSGKSLPPQMVEMLPRALEAAIRSAFEPLPAQDVTIPIYKEPNTTPYIAVEEVTFMVSRSLEEHSTQNLVFLHPNELEVLGVLEGDPILLRSGDEELQSRVAISRLIKPGKAAWNQRQRTPNKHLTRARG